MAAITMGKNEEPQVWYSGDWKTVPRKNVPYNGTEITGIPAYDEDGKFVSADIMIADYTYDLEGVQSRIAALNVDEGWMDIPAAVKPESPPVIDSRFTVNGKLQLRYGSGGLLLGIDFAYGLDTQRHEELGFVFGFPTTIKVEAEDGKGRSAR